MGQGKLPARRQRSSSKVSTGRKLFAGARRFRPGRRPGRDVRDMRLANSITQFPDMIYFLSERGVKGLPVQGISVTPGFRETPGSDARTDSASMGLARFPSLSECRVAGAHLRGVSVS